MVGRASWQLVEDLRGRGNKALRALAELTRRADPSAGPALVEALFLPDEAVRAGALRALAALDPEPGWHRVLAGLATSPLPVTRIAAYDLLGWDSRPASLAVLLARRRSESSGLPRAALEAALDRAWAGAGSAPRGIETPEEFAAARKIARDGDPDRGRELRARLEAGELDTLGRRLVRCGAAADGAELAPVLARCLAEGPRARAVMATRLLRLGTGNWGPEEAEQVFAAASLEDRPGVARALARFGASPIREAFRRDILSPDPRRRRHAARGLGAAGDAADVKALAVLIRAEEEAVAPAAWDAMGELLARIPGAANQAELARLATRAAGARGVEVRRAVARVAPRLAEPKPLLLALQADPEPLVRLAALRAAMRLGWGRRPVIGDLPGLRWGPGD